MNLNRTNRLSGAALAALLIVVEGTSYAQPRPAAIDPHQPVSSDGRPVAAAKAGGRLAASEGFEGFAPAGEDRFFETGAAVDGAAPALEDLSDFRTLASLPPAYGAGGLAKSVIGPDSRTLVSATTTYPWRSVALVTFDGGRCTGWFISKDTVATAGHCVHTGGSSGHWLTNVKVYPGRNGTASPYGFCTAKRLHSVTGWTTSNNEDYDYGAIKLNCTVGNTTGWFGFSWQSASLNGINATISGYPGERPLTQWKAAGSVAVSQSLQLYYPTDTSAGQSGAPVFYSKSGCGQCSIAIHGHGLHGGTPHKTYNHGVRITQAVFNNLVTWKNAQ